MLVIGIVGGIASGKSFVSHLFKELGAEILSGDEAGHEVLREPAVIEQIRWLFGAGAIGATGEVDRRAVAALVFAPPPAGPRRLAELERITHPRIGERLQAQLANFKAAGLPAAILDAPVMLKSGWDKYCDTIVFVDAPREVRVARAKQRGWSEDQLNAREAMQTPIEEKRSRAEYVIESGSNPEQTSEQVAALWKRLVGPAD